MLRKKRTAPCPYPMQGNLDGPAPRRSFSRRDAGVSPEHRERCSGSQAFFRESPWRGSHGNSSFPLILAIQLHLPFGVFFWPREEEKNPFQRGLFTRDGNVMLSGEEMFFSDRFTSFSSLSQEFRGERRNEMVASDAEGLKWRSMSIMTVLSS